MNSLDLPLAASLYSPHTLTLLLELRSIPKGRINLVPFSTDQMCEIKTHFGTYGDPFSIRKAWCVCPRLVLDGSAERTVVGLAGGVWSC